MSLDDATEARILQKVEYVDEATTVLARKRALSESEYLDDREQRAIVEREFQTAIEACIDAGRLLVSAAGEEVPPTNAEVFERLEDLGFIGTETVCICRKLQASGTSSLTTTARR